MHFHVWYGMERPGCLMRCMGVHNAKAATVWGGADMSSCNLVRL